MKTKNYVLLAVIVPLVLFARADAGGRERRGSVGCACVHPRR